MGRPRVCELVMDSALVDVAPDIVALVLPCVSLYEELVVAVLVRSLILELELLLLRVG